MQTTDNSNEWINLIEGAIINDNIKYYEYRHFRNIQTIGSSDFGNVYRANWKNSNKYLTLKSFSIFRDDTAEEIVNEIKHQREIASHENIIRFYGITISNQEDEIYSPKRYFLVTEYADGGTLRDYLYYHFGRLTWDDKLKLAFQLACAISCLHDKGIAHCDLHSGSVLVHQSTIKLSDFGLSKRIKKAPNQLYKLFQIIPYTDPKIFLRQRDSNYRLQPQSYSLNKKSDIYSLGMLLWEISSCRRPFYGKPYDAGLAFEISQGFRETPTPNTPVDYVKIYSDCWDGEPSNRPTINQVVAKLKAYTITKSIDSDLEIPEYGKLIQNLNELNTEEIYTLTPSNDNISIIVDEMVKYSEKQCILNYLSNYKLTLQEIYDWLLNNQNNNSNSVVVLGLFNYLGVGTSVNEKKAFELYQKAANLGNEFGINNLGYCYHYGIGTSVDKQKAYELFQKAANLGNAFAVYNLGYCYHYGIGTSIDKQNAFKLCQKAANLGNSKAQYNLAIKYENGDQVMKDINQAIYWYKKSVKQGNKKAQNKLENLLRSKKI